MKVVILQDYLRSGGTERQGIALAAGLLKANIDTQLLVGQAGGTLDGLAEQTLGSSLEFCSKGLGFPLPNTLLALLRNKKRTQTTLLSMGRWANSITAFLPKGHFKQRIATVRTSRPLPRLYQHSIRTADRLITNSHWAENYTKQSCGYSTGRGPPTSVIHNGLSRSELLKIDAVEKASSRRQLKIPECTQVLLDVARFDKGKCQADIISMMARHTAQPRILYLVGTGPEEAALRALVRSLHLENQVHFTGFQENLRIYYAAADLFVSASRLDSLPNALVEAHAAGLPIVAYPTAGIPEIVKHGQSGYLTTENSADQLHSLSEKLLENSEKSRSFGQVGRKHVVEHFDPHRQMAEYISLLSD